MNVGLYSGAAAVDAAVQRLDAIAGNLANLSTDGFKRRSVAVSSFETALEKSLFPRPQPAAAIDFSQGVLRDTGNDWDLALSGPGFFVVETPTGEAYTRNGRFHVDAEGRLLTLEGDPVGWDGARGVLDPVGERPSVDPTGAVWQGDVRVGKLAVVDFRAPGRLLPDAHGLFRAPLEMRPGPSAATVAQGHLENANAQAVDEMVALVSVQRSFESAARVMSMIEQTYRRLSSQR